MTIDPGPAPIASPPPHDAGQGALFPLETAYGPMVVTLAIKLDRVPRRKCEGCGNRRVCWYIGLGDLITSPKLCMRCIRG